MKTTYRRLVRQRLEAAFKIRIARNQPGLRPVAEAPFDPVPPEVIDLASGPFAARFPELAAARRKGRR
ncbi:MAG TPA: hypothetical protein VL172_10340 [Kofleriaceae bacterium]|nr:hypothetical protein [Kofleriaceae bacterium]